MLDRLKQTAQATLKSLGLYHRVKTSFAWDFYWRFANPRLIEERENELTFFRRTLQGFKPGELIFDVGANRGRKTDIFLRLGAHVIAVEPDESNQAVLRDGFLRYRITKKPVTIIGKAMSDRVGVETMWVHEPGSAKNTLNSKWVATLQSDGARFGKGLQFGQKVEVETTTVGELIRTYGAPFYIKIDVEGHEPSVLRGLHTRVPFVSFEVNLPEFKSEAVQCVELLHALDADGEFNYTADCAGEMVLAQWLEKPAFLRALDSCRVPSIEVFWRTSLA
jgi:FkbM family methyltransferase